MTSFLGLLYLSTLNVAAADGQVSDRSVVDDVGCSIYPAEKHCPMAFMQGSIRDLSITKITLAKGWKGECPPKDKAEERKQKEEGFFMTPELQLVLERQFPSGTDEGGLENLLAEEGFSLGKPRSCGDDLVMRSAFVEFHHDFEGMPTFQRVGIFWKLDGKKIAWIKGYWDSTVEKTK